MTESMSLEMKQRSFPVVERKVLIGFAVLIAAVLVLVVGLKGLGTSGLGTPNAASVAQEQPAQQLITLRSNGFTPTQVNRAGGEFALVVELGKDFRNEEIILQLKRSDGSAVTELRVPAGIPVRSQDVNLQAGQYTLTVINHPEWTCNITVQ